MADNDKGVPEERKRLIEERFDSQRAQWHFSDSCVLLDDTCCARLWAGVRRSRPELVEEVELLYGKDWWVEVPPPLRILLAGFAMTLPNDTDHAERMVRSDAELAKLLRAETVRAIRRTRGSR